MATATEEERNVMSHVRWADVRHKHLDAIGSEDVEQGKARVLARVRAHRLADMRRRRGLTQCQVAEPYIFGQSVGS